MLICNIQSTQKTFWVDICIICQMTICFCRMEFICLFLRNYSERVRGRMTNNTAEIQAATCAIELAKRAGNSVSTFYLL